ncbi:MAG: ATP synthase epsilon chain [Candidatus Omnitrophica bacterium ADurb.Bin277]|nr:MAG: ATP synthase epsilon chain [Candidatus Omnitrophica bacterium ADurb.Bin277]
MDEPVYNLRIVTPQGIAYEGTVAHAQVPAEHGFVGVLANHAPYLTSSAGGKFTIREESGLLREFKVEPGFFEFKSNRAFFLTRGCENL